MKPQKLPKVKIKKIDEKAFIELARQVKKILKEEQRKANQEEKNGLGNTPRRPSLFP